jgi:hypothetical protein
MVARPAALTLLVSMRMIFAELADDHHFGGVVD